MKQACGWLVALALLLGGCQAPAATPRIHEWGWNWQQGRPSFELERVLTALDSPRAIADHLKRNYTFSADYDYTTFMAPDEFLRTRRGCCTAYARFWLTALARLGLHGQFIVAFGPTDSHAVVVFQDAAGIHRMASNDLYFDALDLDPGRQGLQAAARRAAEEFYGAEWRTIVVLDAEGRVQGHLANPGQKNAPDHGVGGALAVFSWPRPAR